MDARSLQGIMQHSGPLLRGGDQRLMSLSSVNPQPFSRNTRLRKSSISRRGFTSVAQLSGLSGWLPVFPVLLCSLPLRWGKDYTLQQWFDCNVDIRPAFGPRWQDLFTAFHAVNAVLHPLQFPPQMNRICCGLFLHVIVIRVTRPNSRRFSE